MNKKAIIGIVVAVIVVAVGIIGFSLGKEMMLKNDPVEYMMHALEKQYQSQSVDATFKMQMELDDDMLKMGLGNMFQNPDSALIFAKEVIGELSFSGRMVSKVDLGKHQLAYYYDMGVQYGDDVLMSVDAHLDTERLIVGSNLLPTYDFLFSKADIFESMKAETGVDFSKLELSKYVDVLSNTNDAAYKAFHANLKVYSDYARNTVLKDLKKAGSETVTLANGQSVSCDVLELEADMETMMTWQSELFQIIETDETLKALAKTRILELLNLLESSGDYAHVNMTLEQLKTTRETVETEFDIKWTQLMSELSAQYGDSTALMSGQNMDVVYKFFIGPKFEIKRLTYTMDVMGNAISYVFDINAMGDAVDFNFDRTAKTPIDIKQLEDPAYSETVNPDVATEAVTTFFDSEVFIKMLDDIEAKADALSGEDQLMVKGAVQQFKENREMMKQMLLSQFMYMQ